MRSFILILLALTLAPHSLWAGEQEKISLAQAMSEALANNLGLRLAQNDEELAAGAALAAEEPFDPLFSAGASGHQWQTTPTIPYYPSEEKGGDWQAAITKRLTSGTELGLRWENKVSDTDLALNLFNPAYTSGLSLTLKQPLLQGFGARGEEATLAAAENEERAATFMVSDAAADLARQVTSAYWQLFFARQDIKVKELSLELARKLRDETRTRIELGNLAAVEIHEPESEVARRQQQLIGARRAIGLAEDQLLLLLNRSDWTTGLQPVDRPPSHLPVPDPGEVAAMARQNRADLAAAKLALSAAQLRQEAAREQTRSRLDLSGSVGISGVDESYGQALDNLSQATDNAWQVGLLFSRPLGKHRARGQAMQARAGQARAKNRAALLTQEINRQVRQSIRDLELANEAVSAAAKTALASQKRLEAQETKFSVGLATTLDVLAAQQAYAQALAGENLSRVQLAEAAANLDRTQGVVRLKPGPPAAKK
ncbi:MAG: TolC family protein [Thermodesulfobacteriota bacterium]